MHTAGVRPLLHEPPIDYWLSAPTTRRLHELKLAAAVAVRTRRQDLGLSQQALAQKLNTSQSRISQLEACRGTTTLDFAVTALVAMDAGDEEIANALNAGACPAVAHLRMRASRVSFLQMKRKSLRQQIQRGGSGRGIGEKDG